MSARIPRHLHAEARGTGAPTLVFLHGLAASGRYWHGVAGRLEGRGRQLQLVDLLGFGRSPWPDLAYTVDDHLDALDAWRGATGLGATPLVLVGHSLGALLALAWAGRAPLVAGAVLIGLPVYHDPVEARRRMARLSPLHRLTLTSRPLARAACAVMCRFRPFWRRVVPLVVRRVPPPVARDGVLHTWRSLSGTLEHCIFGTAFARVRQQAAGLPVLFVHGEGDDTAPVGTVREAAADLPRARAGRARRRPRPPAIPSGAPGRRDRALPRPARRRRRAGWWRPVATVGGVKASGASWFPVVRPDDDRWGYAGSKVLGSWRAMRAADAVPTCTRIGAGAHVLVGPLRRRGGRGRRRGPGGG